MQNILPRSWAPLFVLSVALAVGVWWPRKIDGEVYAGASDRYAAAERSSGGVRTEADGGAGVAAGFAAGGGSPDRADPGARAEFAAAPRPVPKPIKPPPPANPDELIGLDETSVEEMLGTASSIRSEGLAKIKSYQKGRCSLDVVFLLDLKAGGLRVATYQFNETAPPAHATGDCYGVLRGPK